MGVLDVQPRNPTTAAPTLATPTISDSPIAVVGMSRDRKTMIGASTTSPFQIYYSTDDATTWSAPLLTAGDVAQIIGAVETPNMELLLAFSQTRFLSKTTGWATRTPSGGTLTSTGLISSRASGVYARPQWSIEARDELTLACEYGAKTNSPLTNNARYAYMSKDETKFFTIFDLQANTAGDVGLGINPVSGGYHCHAIAYDPWANRVWITGGDNNDWIVYSDDVSAVEVITDGATTSASTTLTAASTTTTTFTTARHQGLPIRGAGIPAGTTIASVTDYRTVVLSQPATATATGVLVNFGTITWNVFHYGRSGRFQVSGILAAPEGVYFGADGYPTGIHLSRRGPTGKPGKLENVLLTAPYSTGTGQHLQRGSFRARDIADAPTLVTGESNTTGVGGYLALIHPDGKRSWKLWDDPWTTNSNESLVQVWHTYAGNIIGSIQSARTTSGWQMFKVPLPKLPSNTAL